MKGVKLVKECDVPKDASKLGARVREMRKSRGLTQVELARRLEISASYLNLIEHQQRSLTAPLLLRLAKEFELDLAAFAADGDDQLMPDLAEVLSDPVFSSGAPTQAELRDFVDASPELARRLVQLFRAYKEASESADSLASRIYDGHQEVGTVAPVGLASEEVSDFIQRQDNYFEALEQRADALRASLGLSTTDDAEVTRTRGLLEGRLVDHLEAKFGIRVEHIAARKRPMTLRRFDAEGKTLQLAEVLPASSRNFQLAAQVALIEHDGLLSDLARHSTLASPGAVALARVVLANYFASAVLMPYEAMLSAVARERYDIELLGQRFGASFEQVCHRLTSLRRPGSEGIPFHMIRVDLAGNISKRFSASGIRFARFAGACPRWNVFRAFLSPGAIRVQTSVMPDGDAYFCVARTVLRGYGDYHMPRTILAIGLGCQMQFARDMVYSDGVDIDTVEGALPIGVTCRLCERTDCEQRAFPSIRIGAAIDENLRGPSPYATPRE